MTEKPTKFSATAGGAGNLQAAPLVGQFHNAGATSGSFYKDVNCLI